MQIVHLCMEKIKHISIHKSNINTSETKCQKATKIKRRRRERKRTVLEKEMCACARKRSVCYSKWWCIENKIFDQIFQEWLSLFFFWGMLSTFEIIFHSLGLAWCPVWHEFDALSNVQNTKLHVSQSQYTQSEHSERGEETKWAPKVILLI